MSNQLQLEPYTGDQVRFDSNWMEQILLELYKRLTSRMPRSVARTLTDLFRIQIVWDRDTAVLTSAMAVAGGLLGGYTGGRMGAAIGAGIGTATGLGVSTVVSLREIWTTVKEKLQELLFIVFNYLRRLDSTDYIRAFDILMACSASRRELVLTILDFIAEKLGRQVISSITAA